MKRNPAAIAAGFSFVHFDVANCVPAPPNLPRMFMRAVVSLALMSENGFGWLRNVQ
jgi:hypothetical protein